MDALSREKAHFDGPKANPFQVFVNLAVLKDMILAYVRKTANTNSHERTEKQQREMSGNFLQAKNCDPGQRPTKTMSADYRDVDNDIAARTEHPEHLSKICSHNFYVRHVLEDVRGDAQICGVICDWNKRLIYQKRMNSRRPRNTGDLRNTLRRNIEGINLLKVLGKSARKAASPTPDFHACAKPRCSVLPEYLFQIAPFGNPMCEIVRDAEVKFP
ncbi:MAG: hypothetical protein JWN45_3414 [Acidobacteriaceae bacterium]|nr:hypothetical protein [Acidobacteriaceae bacterium]